MVTGFLLFIHCIVLKLSEEIFHGGDLDKIFFSQDRCLGNLNRQFTGRTVTDSKMSQLELYVSKKYGELKHFTINNKANI